MPQLLIEYVIPSCISTCPVGGANNITPRQKWVMYIYTLIFKPSHHLAQTTHTGQNYYLSWSRAPRRPYKASTSAKYSVEFMDIFCHNAGVSLVWNVAAIAAATAATSNH